MVRDGGGGGRDKVSKEAKVINQDNAASGVGGGTGGPGFVNTNCGQISMSVNSQFKMTTLPLAHLPNICRGIKKREKCEEQHCKQVQTTSI